ncbi:hypothetical protein TSUD_317570 [Trifolium subterraneum]|uniref:Uncharacterized protein n=1 Tax=Trifolium subterraneum TaxID=3900 RepID=A0A2Z6N5G4_TRISU|nr:hypothetical protein TSUD_317570 [Trifolium subterraneum]
MSGNGSGVSCGFLFAQQLSGNAADDGLSTYKDAGVLQRVRDESSSCLSPPLILRASAVTEPPYPKIP